MGVGSVLFGLLTCGAWLLLEASMQESAKKKAYLYRSPSCAGQLFAVQFVGWDGSRQIFDFSSGAYAIEFALSNAKKLVNVSPELRSGLAKVEAERQQALASEREAKQRRALEQAQERQRALAEQEERQRRAQEAERERQRALEARRNDPVVIEREFRACLAKVEGGKTPAARRAALRAGLLALQQRLDQRQRLMVEASRVEVEAALAKADSLKTVAAKRRVLSTALEELRQDDIADELQAQQIKWLEDALAGLEGGNKYDIRAV